MKQTYKKARRKELDNGKEAATETEGTVVSERRRDSA
jgi:hypothetical protein